MPGGSFDDRDATQSPSPVKLDDPSTRLELRRQFHEVRVDHLAWPGRQDGVVWCGASRGVGEAY